MAAIEELIPNLVTLFKETKCVTDNFGKINIFENFFSSFLVNRIYLISDVKEGTIRGNHSHKELHQLLISVNGSISIDVDDGTIKKTVILNSSNRALYIGPNVWRTMTWNDNFATLIVLASKTFDEDDYIRDYNDFLNWRNNEDNSI